MANATVEQQTTGKTGKRYTPEQKKEILDFVKKQGKGGAGLAKEKYGVTYLTLKKWFDAENSKTDIKPIKTNRTVSVAKSNTGKRYSEEEKAQILKYYFDNKDSRGIISETIKKFGVSYIAFNKWREKFGNNFGKILEGNKSKKTEIKTNRVVGRPSTNKGLLKIIEQLNKAQDRMKTQIHKLQLQLS